MSPFDCMTKATYRQVRCALKLLKQAGYSTNYMGVEFAELGATIEDRRGVVEDWIKNMKVTECSKLIATLTQKAGQQ